jgi:hypothetical protein
MAAQRPVRNECMHLWCNLLHIPVRPSAYVHLLGPAKLLALRARPQCGIQVFYNTA